MKFAGKTRSRKSYATDAERWRALTERDAGADGHFVYSVASTGVYCRPACPSRLASRKNVTFHNSAAEAQSAGFRPCRRCHPETVPPLDRHGDLILRACRSIEQSEATPGLAELARAAGFSPSHFQRVFKSATGVSPREYAAAHRTRRARAELRTAPSVTSALYNAGYSSSSRFYERTGRSLGMAPSAFREGGVRQQIRYTMAPSSLGLVLIAATPRGICAVEFGEDREGLEANFREAFAKATIQRGDPEFRRWVKAALDAIEEPARARNLPLDVRGTAFQHRVWQALREIPAGATATYTQIAARIGAPSAIRAVARACASNPAAVLVPCHRVVRKDKSLAGYRWGLARKRALLEKEQERGGPI